MSTKDRKPLPEPAAIQATEFQAPDAVQSAAATSAQELGINRSRLAQHTGARWWQSQFNLMLLAFGLLGLATLVFVMLGPKPDDLNQRTLIRSDGQSTVGTSTVATESSSVSEAADAPFSEAALQQARKDSQEVLADLLALKKFLEGKQADQWAVERFNLSLEFANRGDEQYKQRNFKAAIDDYQASLATLQAIEASIPQQVNERVAAGQNAIREGKAALARERFEAALLLDRNHLPALQGLDRVATLDQLLELLARASQHERDFAESDDLSDLQLAEQVYQEAFALDSASQQAQSGLERVAQQLVDKQYRLAMTRGFNALFARRYTTARQGFTEALKFKPEDATAKGALQQSLAADKRTSLSALLREAKSFEEREQWGSALSNYQAVLQRDRNQVAAKVGQIRTQARLDVDRAIKQVLADPLSLSKATDRARAQSVLSDAKGLSVKGPRLTEQINQLEALLSETDAVVKVALNSDELTQVSLKKEGAKRIDLGKFGTKKLALKPGRYTLIGSRLGFRDVRTEIELLPGTQGVKTMTISCTDLIAEAG